MSRPLYDNTTKLHACRLVGEEESRKSFAHVARTLDIRGGRETVRRWYTQYNPITQQLEQRERGHRKRKLTSAQVEEHIGQYIDRKNQEHAPVTYRDVHAHVNKKLKLDVSYPTISRYGKEELGIKAKRPKELTRHEGTYTYTTTLLVHGSWLP